MRLTTTAPLLPTDQERTMWTCQLSSTAWALRLLSARTLGALPDQIIGTASLWYNSQTGWTESNQNGETKFKIKTKTQTELEYKSLHQVTKCIQHFFTTQPQVLLFSSTIRRVFSTSRYFGPPRQ